MCEIINITNPQEELQRIKNLSTYLHHGFMALALDYGYHINATFMSGGTHPIYELRDSINYRIKSAEFHLFILFSHKNYIAGNFAEILKNDPHQITGYAIRNPYFEKAEDEIMALYDSIIFHLSSCFDYLAMIINFVFGKNPQKKLQWITLCKFCHSTESCFFNTYYAKSIIEVNSNFVSKFNDYRAELIHRKNSKSYTNLTYELYSGKIDLKFKSSTKIKSNFKKIVDADKEYCISFISSKIIEQSIIEIAKVLEGVMHEFKNNYKTDSPIIPLNGFQTFCFDEKLKRTYSPAENYWEEFIKIKNVC